MNKFIFGLEPKKSFDHQDLQNVIKSKISFQRDENSESIYRIYINTPDPEVDLKLLEASIYETDNSKITNLTKDYRRENRFFL